MKKSEDDVGISEEVKDLYLEEEKLLLSSEEWGRFSKSYVAFRKSAFKASLPFDPRFNAVHWGLSVGALCREIAFGYCWMNAYARYYRKQTSPVDQPAHVHFHLSYFADNSITRVTSCRDKIALMIWAFYCPFNPEKRSEMLDYPMVLDRLKHPLRYGLSFKNHEGFLGQLDTLKGPGFDRMVTYRHLKVHRMEPRIEIYGVKPHHGWDYMFPIYEQNEITRWGRELKKLYSDKKHRENIAKGCRINGVLFEQRKIKDSLWGYEEVQPQLRKCLSKLLQVAGACFDILRSRTPLKKKRRTKNGIGMLVKR